MRDMMAACSSGLLDGTPLLDLSHLEESGGGPDVAVALQTNGDRLVLLQMDGRLPAETFEKVTDLARAGCGLVAGYMRGALLEHTRTLALAKGAVRL
jgi:exosome complex component RRP41